MPESAAEYRCTNARAHLLSQLFDSPPNSDSPPWDSSDILSLTAAARLRRPHRTNPNLPALCRLVELTIFL